MAETFFAPQRLPPKAAKFKGGGTLYQSTAAMWNLYKANVESV
jgi:hypothetical protein